MMRQKPILPQLVGLVPSPARPGVTAGALTVVTPRSLGIMRHAQQFRPYMKKKEEPLPGCVLSATGRREAEAVAGRLAEYVVKEIDGLSGGLSRGCESRLALAVCILHAPSRVAAETAQYVARAIVDEALPKLGLAPDDGMLTRAIRAICEEHDALSPDAGGLRSKNLTEHPPIVIEVGHDPDLTVTLHDELGYRQPWPIRRLASRTPLRSGEVAMLGRTDNGGWEIDYVVSPGSQDEIVQLQAKLKSKMDTAKVLGAFLTGLAFFAGKAVVEHESRPDWYPWVAGTGMALLAFAVVAYFVTMFLYDSLLMPTAFWPTGRKLRPEAVSLWAKFRENLKADCWYRVVGTGQRPSRPPSSAATVILHSMQRVWGGMFVPATLAAGLGAALVGIALAQPTGAWWWAAFIGALILVVAAVLTSATVSRPDLGHSD